VTNATPLARSSRREELFRSNRRGRDRHLVAPAAAIVDVAADEDGFGMRLQRVGELCRPGRLGNAVVVEEDDPGSCVDRHARLRARERPCPLSLITANSGRSPRRRSSTSGTSL